MKIPYHFLIALSTAIFIILIPFIATNFLPQKIFSAPSTQQIDRELPADYYDLTLEKVDCQNGKLVDSEIGLSLTCPENLDLYRTTNRYDPYQQKQERIYIFCESEPQLVYGQYLCRAGGVKIWANGDGWGGGCETENLAYLNYGNEVIRYCQYDDSFNQLYMGESETKGKIKLLLSGTYSSTFPKAAADKLLQSITLYY